MPHDTPKHSPPRDPNDVQPNEERVKTNAEEKKDDQGGKGLRDPRDAAGSGPELPPILTPPAESIHPDGR
jgi:hypothetical protein